MSKLANARIGAQVTQVARQSQHHQQLRASTAAVAPAAAAAVTRPQHHARAGEVQHHIACSPAIRAPQRDARGIAGGPGLHKPSGVAEHQVAAAPSVCWGVERARLCSRQNTCTEGGRASKRQPCMLAQKALTRHTPTCADGVPAGERVPRQLLQRVARRAGLGADDVCHAVRLLGARRYFQVKPVQSMGLVRAAPAPAQGADRGAGRQALRSLTTGSG